MGAWVWYLLTRDDRVLPAAHKVTVTRI